MAVVDGCGSEPNAALSNLSEVRYNEGVKERKK